MTTTIKPSSSSQQPPTKHRDPRAAAEDLYDIFREARMNVKYYGEKLAYYQKWNLRIEIAVAIGTSTTLMSLPFFKSGVAGIALTGVLGTVAAVLGVLKPILGLPKKIERNSKLWSGYMAAFVSAQSLVRRAKLHQTIDVIDEQTMREIHERMDALCVDDDPCPKPTDLDRLQGEVNVLYPKEEFWWPPQPTVA